MLRNAAVVALMLGTSVAHAQSRATLVSTIDSMVTAFLKAGPSASAAVAVVRGRDTLVMRGFGEADIATRRRAGPTTVYQIGSLTKQFTSAAIMRLVERGAVKLDADLSTYLPSFPLQGHHVTIRQLLNHTSGIHSYTSSREWQSHWAEDLSPDSIVGFVKRDTFDFAPGTRWLYDNTGYVLLGMVIEKASGRPYATYLNDEFFRPLGLKQTRYCPNHPPDTSFATGYSVRTNEVVPATYLSLTQPFAAGAICSTVRDFLVWQRALPSGRVVGSSSYAAMTTPDTLSNGRRLTYGFGLQADRLGKHRAISHTGGINGFTTAASWWPDDTLSVVIFTNIDNRSPVSLTRDIARVVLGVPVPPEAAAPKAVALEPALRDRVAGTYTFESNARGISKIRVLVEGNRVYVQGDGITDAFGGPVEAGAPIVYIGQNTFGAGFDPAFRLQFANEDGQLRVSLEQKGVSARGRRVP